MYKVTSVQVDNIILYPRYGNGAGGTRSSYSTSICIQTPLGMRDVANNSECAAMRAF